MKNLALSIFDSKNKQYLTAKSINDWLIANFKLIDFAPQSEILAIFSGLVTIKVFDSKFIEKLCSIISKKLDNLTFAELTAILESLKELNYSKDLTLISNIVTKLSQESNPQPKEILIESIWLLAKLNFYDSAFFQYLEKTH